MTHEAPISALHKRKRVRFQLDEEGRKSSAELKDDIVDLVSDSEVSYNRR